MLQLVLCHLDEIVEGRSSSESFCSFSVGVLIVLCPVPAVLKETIQVGWAYLEILDILCLFI